MYQDGDLDFSQITTVNLDEYKGLPGSHEQSYRYFMNTHLFHRVNISYDNTYVPDGTETDSEKCCQAYNELIHRVGPADIQLLGLQPETLQVPVHLQAPAQVPEVPL